jgi:hypothetical protein
MDLVRSCYTSTMRFFSDSDVEIPVRWFFCDSNAKVFPHVHRFGSSNWDPSVSTFSGPGEVKRGSPQWSNGALVPGMLGQLFCGPLAVYQAGAVYPGVPLNADSSGLCMCCGSVPSLTCAQFEATFATLKLRITRVTGTPPIQRGHVGDVITLPQYIFPCQYSVFQPFGGGVPLRRLTFNYVQRAFVGQATSSVQAIFNASITLPEDAGTVNPNSFNFSSYPIGLCSFPTDNEVWDFNVNVV